jgi:hypothetical protein
MKKKRINRSIAVLIAANLIARCWLPTPCEAQDIQTGPQHFAYSATLDTVRAAGFYRITLMPDLVAKCKQDLSDLRIGNQDGKFEPYVLKSDLPVFSSGNFTEFAILSNERLKDSSTEAVIGNGSPGAVSTLLLIMKNSSVHRTAVLSGSDDRQKWFVIREHIVLEEAGSDTADHYVQAISFPSTNYRFFKLILDDKGLLPLNILKAGINTRNTTNGRYIGVPYPAIIQKDSSDRHSYITVQYRDNYRIDKLELILQGPVLFKRRAWVHDGAMMGEATHGTGGEERQLAETDLSPGNTSFLVSSAKTNRLIIDIANGDDKPLIIQAVKTGELNRYVLTYLQPGNGYSLLAGNPGATAPEYDLKYFTDSLSRDPEELAAGPLSPVRPGQEPVTRVAPDHSGLILWSVLILVLLSLAFLSFKMANAIRKKT